MVSSRHWGFMVCENLWFGSLKIPRVQNLMDMSVVVHISCSHCQTHINTSNIAVLPLCEYQIGNIIACTQGVLGAPRWEPTISQCAPWPSSKVITWLACDTSSLSHYYLQPFSLFKQPQQPWPETISPGDYCGLREPKLGERVTDVPYKLFKSFMHLCIFIYSVHWTFSTPHGWVWRGDTSPSDSSIVLPSAIFTEWSISLELMGVWKTRCSSNEILPQSFMSRLSVVFVCSPCSGLQYLFWP